jgi:hypothetical protein
MISNLYIKYNASS